MLKRTVRLPLWFLVLFCILPGRAIVQAQPTHAAPQPPGPIRSLLAEWGRSLKPFARDRNTVVFTTSLEQCTGCCSSAINDIVRALEGAGMNANIVVLVGARFPEEVATVRRLFKHPNVVADAGGTGWAALGAPRDVPCLYLLSPGGGVLFRWDDVQHNLFLPTMVNALRWTFQAPRAIRPAAEVKLAEAKDARVLDAYSPFSDGRSVTFVDPRAGLIHRFSVTDGRALSTVSLPDTASLRFRRPTDNPDYWKMLQEHYSPLHRLYAVGPNVATGGQLVLGEFHTGYDSTLMGDGRKRIDLLKAMCVGEMAGGQLGALRAYAVPSGYVVPPVVADSAGRFIAPYQWDTGRMQISTQERLDSGYVLARSSPATATFEPLAPLRELGVRLGTTLDPVMSVLPCAGANGSLFFYDEVNTILCRLDTVDGGPGMRIVPLWNGAAFKGAAVNAAISHVELLPRLADGASPAAPEPVTALEDRSVHGLATDGAHLDIVAVQTINDRDLVTVRRARADGTIIDEVAFSRAKDSPVSAYPIGYRDGMLMVLVKWEKARWIITSLRLPE